MEDTFLTHPQRLVPVEPAERGFCDLKVVVVAEIVVLVIELIKAGQEVLALLLYFVLLNCIHTFT